MDEEIDITSISIIINIILFFFVCIFIFCFCAFIKWIILKLNALAATIKLNNEEDIEGQNNMDENNSSTSFEEDEPKNNSSLQGNVKSSESTSTMFDYEVPPTITTECSLTLEQSASPQHKEYTALHESCHVVCCWKHGFPIDQVTIVSTPNYGGVTHWQNKEKYCTDKELEERILIFFCGPAGDQMLNNRKTTGGENDYQKGTNLPRAMVYSYGVVKGPSTVGRGTTQEGERPRELLVLEIIDRIWEKAKKFVKEQEALIRKFAAVLVQKETIIGDEVIRILERLQEELDKKRLMESDSEEKKKQSDELDVDK